MQDKVQLISSKNNMSHNNKKEYQQTNINKNRLPQTFKRNAPAIHRKKAVSTYNNKYNITNIHIYIYIYIYNNIFIFFLTYKKIFFL